MDEDTVTRLDFPVCTKRLSYSPGTFLSLFVYLYKSNIFTKYQFLIRTYRTVTHFVFLILRSFWSLPVAPSWLSENKNWSWRSLRRSPRNAAISLYRDLDTPDHTAFCSRMGNISRTDHFTELVIEVNSLITLATLEPVIWTSGKLQYKK